jgi:putative transcriptional regulator
MTTANSKNTRQNQGQEKPNFQNQFLIAMPSMQDPHFAGGVTLICEHNDDGALGIVVNRKADAITIGDIFKQLELEPQQPHLLNTPAYWGGPVARERGFVLHDGHQDWESCIEVEPGLNITSSRDILEAIAAGTGPQHWLFALGYAGWEKGQLEEEMVGDAWLMAPANKDIIFSLPVEHRLRAAAGEMGVDLGRLVNTSGHA